MTITDEVSEMALTFGVAVNDDDTLTLDMGDLGSATVEEATLAVAVQGLKYAVENGTVDELSNSFSGTKICDFEDTPLRIDLFGGECFFCAGGFRMAGKMV